MRRGTIAGIVALAFLVLAAPAGATQVKLGKVAPLGASPGACGDCAGFALRTDPTSPSYKVPHGRWSLVSWSVMGDPSNDAAARLRIYRPTATKGQYKLVEESKKGTVPSGGKSPTSR